MNSHQKANIVDCFKYNQQLKEDLQEPTIKAVSLLSKLTAIKQSTIINHIKTVQKL
jgi:hypothetical protein